MPLNCMRIRAAAVLILLAANLLLAGCRAGEQKAQGKAAAVLTVTATKARAVEPTGTLPASPTTLRPRSTDTPAAAPMATGTPTMPPGWREVPAGRLEAPVLMYHHISDENSSRYALPIKDFRKQMEYLRSEGYQPLTVSQMAEVLRSGGALPEKPVILTFDDGYLDVYENAFPILKEMGFTATAYIITSTLEASRSYGYMQEAQLKELRAAGWEIGSHSVTHTSLTKTKLGIGNEMKQSKAALEKILGEKVTSFSYPYGTANTWIKERAEEYGYENAVGVDIFVTHPAKRLFYLSRREVTRGISMAEFRALLVPSKEEAEANALLLTATPEPHGEEPPPAPAEPGR